MSLQNMLCQYAKWNKGCGQSENVIDKTNEFRASLLKSEYKL